MRLKSREKSAIVAQLERVLLRSQADLYLIGSRVNDSKRGGDIDLLVLVERQEDVELLERKKTRLVYDIQGEIGEQKIDITVKDKKDSKSDPFLQEVLPEAILLHSWPG